jgi:uncharacterized protein (DUF2235 family)
MPGVGTTGYSDRIVGGLWGAGTTTRIRSVYRSVCEAFEPGDRISLFGFSRGAFAARVIAGLIGTIGMARPDQLGQVDDAVAFYRALRGPLSASAFVENGLRKPVDILFVGLWDTVVRHGPALAPLAWLLEGALNRRFGLTDHRPGRPDRYIAHALALDEERFAFRPWRVTASVPGHTVDEVWFAGSHSDVGGGCSESRPSELALLWMINRARFAGLLVRDPRDMHSDACTAPLNPSRVGAWRLLRAGRRVVEESDRIHDSVHARMRATGYKPIAKLPSTYS